MVKKNCIHVELMEINRVLGAIKAEVPTVKKITPSLLSGGSSRGGRWGKEKKFSPTK